MLKISVVVFGIMLCDLTTQVYAADQSPSSVEQATAGQQSIPDRQQITERIEILASDTLSGIALRVRPNDSVSIEQVMLAIQAANPNAFIGGNINRMRSDLDLRVPSLREIILVDVQAAINEVARQIQELSEIEAEPLAQPMDATLTQGDQSPGQLNVIAINDELAEVSRRIEGSAYEENLELENYSGLAYKHPVIALTMTIFLLSLGGLPPLAGFVAKFFIFSAALKEGYIILVIIAVLNSAISFYYYLKVIVFMYMKEPVKEFHISLTPMTLLVIAISAFGTIQLGIFPDPIIALAQAN